MKFTFTAKILNTYCFSVIKMKQDVYLKKEFKLTSKLKSFILLQQQNLFSLYLQKKKLITFFLFIEKP